jgi:hypothetical protein
MAQYFEPSTDTDGNFGNSVEWIKLIVSFYLRFTLKRF